MPDIITMLTSKGGHFSDSTNSKEIVVPDMISQNNHRNKIEELLKLFVFVGTQVDQTLWKATAFGKKKKLV